MDDLAHHAQTSRADHLLENLLHPKRSAAREKEHLEINGQGYFYRHLAIEIAPVDIPSWLKAQNLLPKVCWMERGGKIQRAAVGSLLQFSSIPHISMDSHPEVRLYGGRQFGVGSVDPDWDPFPSCAFWLPQFEIVQESEHCVLHIHFIDENAHPGAMQKLSFNPPLLQWKKTHLETRIDFPPFLEWENLVETSLDNIKKGVLEKIVIARKTKLSSQEGIDPYALLSQLTKNTQRATVFSFQTTPECVFMGATPEKLYHREGVKLQTEAIAGSIARSKLPEEDRSLADELLKDPKELREFSYVKQFIQASLEPLCQEIAWLHKDQILQMPYIQHIHNHLNATLKYGVSDHDLIATLHPTPALGGKPRTAALSLLSELEPFHRGWYGAPIGYISHEVADICVAIRSALVWQFHIDLFAGTGIVKESCPFKEWEELEQKISMFKGLFE